MPKLILTPYTEPLRLAFQEHPKSEVFSNSHTFCTKLIDKFDKSMSLATENGAGSFSMNISSSESVELENSDNCWAVLDLPKYKSEKLELVYRTLVIALVNDFVKTVAAGLALIDSGFVSQGDSLFRKPFQENLTVLEVLLVDRDEYLCKFLENSNTFTKTTLGNNRSECISKIFHSNSLEKLGLSSEYIHTLRFCKDITVGLAGYWDQQVHLVTTQEEIQTSNGNLNFIFSGDHQTLTHLKAVYSRLPYLLTYSWFVIEAHIEEIWSPSEGHFKKMMSFFSSELPLVYDKIDEDYLSEELSVFANAWKFHADESCFDDRGSPK